MSAQRVARVMIVDDSAVVRQVLSTVLGRDPGVEVIGTAADPIFALQKMERDWPDVVVLDIEMPRMDGLTFLKQLMSTRPTPVVVCSTLTERGAETTMQAMASGAVGFVTKPVSGLRTFLEEDAGELVRAVKAAAASDMGRVRATTTALAGLRPGPAVAAASPTAAPVARRPGAFRPTPQVLSTATAASPPAPRRPGGPLSVTTDRLVAIGTSTGGTQALEFVLSAMPRVTPGIVVVQHMPEKFTAAFANRLNGVCAADVMEATDGQRVLPGHILIAPGGLHMSVVRDGAHYRVKVTDGERVNRHKPSVDVLFDSVAAAAGRNALGVIMTGMGDDGARGLLRMREAGAQTVGQDERSCVVYGMPAAARQLGAVQQEVPLSDIAHAIGAFAGHPLG